MPEHPHLDGQQKDIPKANATNLSPLADIISLETVVNLLIQKGLCTPEELFEAEQEKRQYEEDTKEVSIVHTDSPPSRDKKDRRKKQSWLKRKMSQKRWSRRLATTLFGWEWKKVKHEKKKMPSERVQEEMEH